MKGYLFDTSFVSRLYDPSRQGHKAVSAVASECNGPKFISSINIGELKAGINLAELNLSIKLDNFKLILAQIESDALVLNVSPHTATCYGEIKARIRTIYYPNAIKKKIPKYIEDWIHHTTGKQLKCDENDIWLCAQALERNLIFVTCDRNLYENISPVITEVEICYVDPAP